MHICKVLFCFSSSWAKFVPSTKNTLQEAHGPHRPHEKSDSTNKHICAKIYDKTISWFREREKIILFVKACVPFTLRCSVRSFTHWFWTRRLIFSKYFRDFVIISQWERSLPIIWINLNTLYHQILKCVQSVVETGQDKEERFLVSSSYGNNG